MPRLFPSFADDVSFANRVTGRFDALSHLAALEAVETPAPAKTPVAAVINKMAADPEAVALGHKRAFDAVFGTEGRDPTAFRRQVMAYTAG